MTAGDPPAPLSALRFEGRVAVVTGAGRGMGAAHARLLAERGAKVLVNDLGCSVDGLGASSEPAETVAAEIRAAGGDAVANSDSVASEAGGRAIITTALDAFGRVDIVVHNAGITSSAPFTELTTESLHRMLNTHLVGGFMVVQEAWPHMVAQGGGRVVLITSTVGLLGAAGFAHYAAAKMALIGLSNVLSVEGAAHGIGVNALATGAYTRMQQQSRTTSDARDELADWRMAYMTPERVSPVVAWLAHPDCPVSGQILYAGGGHVHRFFLGATPGHVGPDLTPEGVRDHFGEITDEDGYRTFRDVGARSIWSRDVIMRSAAMTQASHADRAG